MGEKIKQQRRILGMRVEDEVLMILLTSTISDSGMCARASFITFLKTVFIRTAIFLLLLIF